eukprot:jgi/Mesen1/6119/ME000311S05213
MTSIMGGAGGSFQLRPCSCPTCPGSSGRISTVFGSKSIAALGRSYAWAFLGVASTLLATRGGVRCEALQAGSTPPSVQVDSHQKESYTDYTIIRMPGDGRCLFRAVAHGACVRSGMPAPSHTLQAQLADELRAKAVDELVKRREEIEWCLEGKFEDYVAAMRRSHVWGGEPELLMLSHVLRAPITVYIPDAKNVGGIISIQEYGQDHANKHDPIRVLYNGSSHYDALQFPYADDKLEKLSSKL